MTECNQSSFGFEACGRREIVGQELRPKMSNHRSSVVRVVMLGIILQTAASVHAQQQPAAVNLCDVVASPSGYNQKVLTVEGILFPSEHSLALYSLSCKPTEQSDVSVQAILSQGWESLPNGKHLRKFLSKGKPAHVKVTGTFESGADRYGPDVARFRFTVTGISSVEAAPPGFHL
jgi:hypothetical protein